MKPTPQSAHSPSPRKSTNNVTVGGHEKSVIPLPSAASQLAFGGSGRYALAVLPEPKQLIVVDIAARQIVKTIALDDADVRIAGGQSKFVIHHQTQGTLARYDLNSGECDLKIACPPYRYLAMGVASEGPLLAVGNQLDLIDLPGMKEIQLEFATNEFPSYLANHLDSVIYVTDDGKSFISLRKNSPPRRYKLEFVAGAWRYRDEPLGNLYMDRIYGPSNQLFLTQEPSPPYQALPGALKLLSQTSNSPLLILADIELPSLAQPGPPSKTFLPSSQRVAWLSALDAVVWVPAANDQLIVQHFNPKEDLRKLASSDQHVISPLLDYIQKGEPYSNQIAVLSTTDITKYSLVSGPVGMTISDTGLLSWDVPESFRDESVVASFSLRDTTGQQSEHQLVLRAVNDSQARQMVVKSSTVFSPTPAQRPKTASATPEKSLDVVRAPITVPLPGPAHAIAVGGSGKYLIAHLAKQNSVVIVDVVAKKIRTTIPVEGNVLLAAGETKLVVYQDAGTLTRYDLASGESEQTVPCGKYFSLALGSSSEGPLACGGATVDFFDLQTMKRTGLAVTNTHAPLPFEEVRASANGRIFAATDRRGFSGACSLEIDGTQVQQRTCPPTLRPQPIRLSYDGTYLFTAAGRCDRDWKILTPKSADNGARRVWPAATGPYLLSFNAAAMSNAPAGMRSRLSLYCQNDDHAVLTIMGVTLPAMRDVRNGGISAFRQDFYLLPIAGALVAVPEDKNQFDIYPFSIQEELDRSGVDYFFVTSTPPCVIQPGQSLTYRIEVASKYADLKFRLESGPAGMAISEAGELSWQVPKDFAEQEVNAVINIQNAAGQDLSHKIRMLNANPPADGRRSGGRGKHRSIANRRFIGTNWEQKIREKTSSRENRHHVALPSWLPPGRARRKPDGPGELAEATWISYKTNLIVSSAVSFHKSVAGLNQPNHWFRSPISSRAFR
jgi:hypothetical protein